MQQPIQCLEARGRARQTRRPLTASSVQSSAISPPVSAMWWAGHTSCCFSRTLSIVYDTSTTLGSAGRAVRPITRSNAHSLYTANPRQRERGRTISTRVLEGLLGAPRGGAAVHGIQRTNSLQADLVVRAVTVRQPATRREKVLHRLGPAARLLRALHAEAGGDV